MEAGRLRRCHKVAAARARKLWKWFGITKGNFLVARFLYDVVEMGAALDNILVKYARRDAILRNNRKVPS